MKNFLAICLIFNFLNACKTKPENEVEVQIETEEKSNENSLNKEQPCNAILPEAPLDFEGEDYNFTRIDTAYFVDENIHISYQFSGCTEGEPVLAVVETANGKRSTIISLTLKLKDAGLCEMLLQKESCFSLSETAVVGKEFQINLNGENTYFYRP